MREEEEDNRQQKSDKRTQSALWPRLANPETLPFVHEFWPLREKSQSLACALMGKVINSNETPRRGERYYEGRKQMEEEEEEGKCDSEAKRKRDVEEG